MDLTLFLRSITPEELQEGAAIIENRKFIKGEYPALDETLRVFKDTDNPRALGMIDMLAILIIIAEKKSIKN